MSAGGPKSASAETAPVPKTDSMQESEAVTTEKALPSPIQWYITLLVMNKFTLILSLFKMNIHYGTSCILCLSECMYNDVLSVNISVRFLYMCLGSLARA